MMHICLCNNINNRLSIGGLTLYCTSNNPNIDSVRTKHFQCLLKKLITKLTNTSTNSQSIYLLQDWL